MAWRFSSNKRTSGRASALAGKLCGLLAVLALAVALLGCGRNAVRASEKEYLADRVMIFDSDAQETTADEHVMSNREGSAGGRGTGGGGCGCN